MALSPDEVFARLARELRGLRSVRLGPGVAQRLRALLPRGLVTAREGVVDACVLGAEQLTTTGALVPAPPRALTHAARQIHVVMPNLRAARSPFLIAGHGKLRRAWLWSELGVLEVCADGVVVRELAPGVSARELQELVDATTAAAGALAPASARETAPSDEPVAAATAAPAPATTAPVLRIPANVAEMRVLRDGPRHGLA